MSNDIFATIRIKYNTLSDSQKSVADYILVNPEKVMYSSLGDLAANTNVSETTVLRFLRKLNYNSYQVFKVHMAQNLSAGTTQEIYEGVAAEDSIEDVVNKVIDTTVCSIQDSLHNVSVSTVEAIIEKIISSNKIFIVGAGSSSAVAFDLYHKLLKLGFNCNYSSDVHLINIICSGLTKEDLLICVSHSGESREVLSAVEQTEEAGCNEICAFTSFENSTLASHSKYKLISSSKETYYRTDALTSRTIQMTYIDMLYVSLALKMGDVAIKTIERSREAVAKSKR